MCKWCLAFWAVFQQIQLHKHRNGTHFLKCQFKVSFYPSVWPNKYDCQERIDVIYPQFFFTALVNQTVKKERAKDRGDNILLCRSGEYVSSQVICDGVRNCQTGDDEHNCTDICVQNITELSTRCKRVCTRGRECQCSPLYFGDRNGTCRSFKHQYVQPSFLSSPLPEGWYNPDADHELLLKSFFQSQERRKYRCYPDMLWCLDNSSNCFNVSDICVYSLDVFGHLLPCRTGSHLQVCENFTCNNRYKCPGYYCIRFGYVCDGKNDCPFGEDEISCDNMSDCRDFYRCRNSKQCIQLNDICNNIKDCKYGDDEGQCQLYNVKCPFGCICLHFALYCTNMKASQIKRGSIIYIIVLNLNAPLTSNVMGHIVSPSGMYVITLGIVHMVKMKIIAKITLIIVLVYFSTDFYCSVCAHWETILFSWNKLFGLRTWRGWSQALISWWFTEELGQNSDPCLCSSGQTT